MQPPEIVSDIDLVRRERLSHVIGDKSNVPTIKEVAGDVSYE